MWQNKQTNKRSSLLHNNKKNIKTFFHTNSINFEELLFNSNNNMLFSFLLSNSSTQQQQTWFYPNKISFYIKSTIYKFMYIVFHYLFRKQNLRFRLQCLYILEKNLYIHSIISLYIMLMDDTLRIKLIMNNKSKYI